MTTLQQRAEFFLDRARQHGLNTGASEGTPVVAEFIDTARSGAGYVEHLWPKPSTGAEGGRMSMDSPARRSAR